MNEIVYHTQTGMDVKIKPVNPARQKAARRKVLEEYKARGEVLEPPTYEVEVGMKGEKQKLPHDAKSILEPDVSDEEKAAWDAYIETSARLEAEQYLRALEVFLLRGTEVELPPDERWIEELEYDGVIVETEPHKRYLQYMYFEVIPSPLDKSGILREITLLSIRGADPDWVRSVEESFRGQAGRKREEADGDDGAAAAG